MKKALSSFFAAGLGSLSLMMLSCGMQPLSGNGSDEGNARTGLYGYLADGRNGEPAEDALVRIYPVYLNKMAQALGKTAAGGPALDSTRTDCNGCYRFDRLENNLYSITAEKVDGPDTLYMRCPTVMFIDFKDMGWDTLHLPGSIKGKILPPYGESAKGVTCYLPGTSYLAVSDDTGAFRITGIPQGTYSLSFMSSRLNDTTLFGISVRTNRETDMGTIALGLDRGKNEHDVWGIFDTASGYRRVRRVEARLTGDNIPADSPRVYSLDWRPDVAGYSGYIYLPEGGLFWKVAVWTYDSLDHRIGAYEIAVNRSTGDVQFPAFDPCNGMPVITLGDTTVSIDDTVPLRPAVTGLLYDDSIVTMAWDIGGTGTFRTTVATDTLVVAPDTPGVLPCLFRIVDLYGNAVVRSAAVQVVRDPPTADAGNDTLVFTNDSLFLVRYDGTDAYGCIVMFRLDVDGDGTFDDSSAVPGEKSCPVPAAEGNYSVVLQVEDDDGNRTSDTMNVTVVAAPVVAQGLVAHWSFDSSSGATYYDVTGHGYDASGTGSGFGLVPGVSGRALNCTGGGYEIAAANSSEDFYLSKFTVECWFYSNVDPSQNSSEGKILDYSYITYGTRNGFSVDMEPTGQLRLVITNPDGSEWVEAATASPVIEAAKWYHLVFTYDSAYCRIYANGVLCASHAYEGTYLAPHSNAHIGYQERSTGANMYYLNGRIDELKLYNYALPADSVAAHYDSGLVTPVLIPYTPDPTSSRRPEFSWYSNNGAISVFRVQIDTTQEFLSPLVSEAVADTFFAPAFDLPYDTIYWRVGKEADPRAWSAPSSLAIIPEEMTGLVAYWSFDSSSGNTYYDVTGHGYDAIASGSGVGLAPGVRGQALSCPGSGYEIYAANSRDDFFIPRFSIECWFYSNISPVFSEYVKILDYSYIQSGGEHNGYVLFLSLEGNLVADMSNASGTAWNTTWDISSTAVTAGRWYHLASTYDGTTYKVYVDGVLCASRLYSGTYVKPPNDARIACARRMDYSNAVMLVNGFLDELKLYNFALPADSVAAHYSSVTP